MDAVCPVHGQPFKFVAPGVSKKTGQPYSGFWSCPEMGCKMKPNQPLQGIRPAVETPYKVVPVNDKMSKEDWEAKEARTDRKILLQVAFKAAVELACKFYEPSNPLTLSQFINQKTLEYHNWLLFQTKDNKAPVSRDPSSKFIGDGFVESVNDAIEQAIADRDAADEGY